MFKLNQFQKKLKKSIKITKFYKKFFLINQIICKIKFLDMKIMKLIIYKVIFFLEYINYHMKIQKKKNKN